MSEIARSGNDYRGAYNGNRRFTGVFRLRSFYMISADTFSKLKQKIACKILFEEEQQALRQSGKRKAPFANFALLRRDGLFCHTIF